MGSSEIIRIFADVMEKRTVIIALMLAVAFIGKAQSDRPGYVNPEDRQIDMDNPTFVPMVKVGEVEYDGDTIQYVELNKIYVYPEPQFENAKQRQEYNRLVYNVKKVLPLAQQANSMIQETYRVMEQLPDKKAKQEHIKQVEKEIMKTYKPEMKKLTYSQGKLLIKLVDRECNQSGYEVVKAFLGPARATFYQVFAWTFKASLKKEYDPEGDDRLTERVVRQVEAGLL